VLAEGVDNLMAKINLRRLCKVSAIPVLMATDNGDNVIVDVERYDVDPGLEIFNGALGDFGQFESFKPEDLPKLATKVAGPELIVPRMLASLLEVGRTLYSWPQLGSAATFTGVATAYLIRSIATGKPVKSGKYDLNLDNIFLPHEKTSTDAERTKHLNSMGL
jgi:hypothetical protein